MTEAAVVAIAQQGAWTLVVMLMPILIPALIVGLMIALFQSLTQLQEMTLTFGPKILVVFLSIALFLPFILQQIQDYTISLYDRIIGLG